jgi:hypothetical protein
LPVKSLSGRIFIATKKSIVMQFFKHGAGHVAQRECSNLRFARFGHAPFVGGKHGQLSLDGAVVCLPKIVAGIVAVEIPQEGLVDRLERIYSASGLAAHNQ